MFVLRHHLPDRYGGATIGGGTRHPDTIAREAADNCPERSRRDCPVCKARAKVQPDAETIRWLDETLHRYDLKVLAERRHRLAGEIVAADFTLRQPTHIELILDAGGRGMDLLDRFTTRPSERGPGRVEINATPLSEILNQHRRAIWEAAGEPPRPTLPLGPDCAQDVLSGSPAINDRHKARRAAEARMAKAQALWEACASEDSWVQFKEIGFDPG